MKTEKNKNNIEETITNEPDLIKKLEDIVYSGKLKKTIYFQNEKQISPDRLIKRFNEKLKTNFIEKSTKLIDHKIRNLSRMVDKNTRKKIFRSKDFLPYFKFSDRNNDNLNKFTIQDPKGLYLKSLDEITRNKNYARIKQLEYNNNKIDENGIKLRKPLFITFTNNTQHHFLMKSKTNKNIYIHNPKTTFTNLEESIYSSIENQTNIWKYFFHNLRTQLKRKELNQQVDFVRVFEQTNGHSNLHSHILLWCDNDEESIKIINKSFLQTVKKFKLYRCECDPVEDNVKILNKKNENNKRRKYKKYKKVASPSSYILKYMSKGQTSEYQRYFTKFRFFSCTSFRSEGITQIKIDKIYKELSRTKPKLMKMFKKSNLPLYTLLELYIKQNITFTYKETLTKTLDIEKIERKKEELIELKRNNWKMVYSLEKETRPSKLLNKVQFSTLRQDIKMKVKEFYDSNYSQFDLRDKEIIQDMMIVIKNNLILNDMNIFRYFEENIEDYQKTTKSKLIKSITNRRNNITKRYDYEVIGEEMTDKEVREEIIKDAVGF